MAPTHVNIQDEPVNHNCMTTTPGGISIGTATIRDA